MFILLEVVRYEQDTIRKIVHMNNFLTLHTILEFTSVIISFIIFTITYYIYSKNSRIRVLIFSCTFFMVGFLDFFYTMSYRGRPVVFTEGFISQTVSFWMASRLVLACGLLLSGWVHYNQKIRLKRIYFLSGSIVIIALIFYVITDHGEWIPDLFIEGKGVTDIKMFLEYMVMIVFAGTAVLYIRDYRMTKDQGFLIFAIGLIFGIFTEIAFMLYKNIYDMYNMIGALYKVASIYLLFKAIFVYNLDAPYVELRKARRQIKVYAKNLEKVVEKRTIEIQNVNQKMLQDLEYAKRIQQSLLPVHQLMIYGVQFISEYIPCEKLSGDFYNIHVMDEEHIGMYIADVAGHGVSAAMMTVFADRIMKMSDLPNKEIRKMTPDKVLAHFYREFNQSDFPSEMHIVIFKAIYNRKTRVLSYCSGGMNAIPILVRRTGEVEKLDKSKGFPICKFGDFFIPKFVSAQLQLNRGDRIIFYTDGLVENFKENTLIREEVLIHLLKNNRDMPLERFNQLILQEVQKHAKDLMNEDDITYFIMEA